MNVIVKVSDARTSANKEDVLVTYALGSCIAVALYDSQVRIGGMLHFQLPGSSADPARAGEKPFMFADTGMRQLVDMMQCVGAERRRLRVRLAGGAQMLNDGGLFDIGRRNYTAIRKLLWEWGMFIEGEQIGGKTPRNMELCVADGMVSIKCGDVAMKI